MADTTTEAAAGWAGLPVLVTGASGFAGQHLVRALCERGARVTGLSRHAAASAPPRCEQRIGAIEDAAFVEAAVSMAAPAVVFHLAAQPLVGLAREKPAATFETNIRGTWLVLDAVRRLAPAARLVLASSDNAYGVQTERPCPETHALAGRHPYDVSKSCADLLATSYAETYGLAIGIARCSNLYGPGDLNWSRLVPATLRAAIEGRRPLIRSDGSPTRDYLHVHDMVSGFLRWAEVLAERPALRGRAFNFASGEPLSVLTMTRLALAAAGREDIEPDVRNEVMGEVAHKQMSITAAARELGWRPGANTRERLVQTAAWYRACLSGAA